MSGSLAPGHQLLTQRFQPLPTPGHFRALQRHSGLQAHGPVEQRAAIRQLLQPGVAGGVREQGLHATGAGALAGHEVLEFIAALLAQQADARQRQRLDHDPFVARFDIRVYYESIDHAVLRAQLREARVDPISQGLVRDYLALPDRRCSGKGMVAGGAISPLLGALYLTPLDKVMQALGQRLGIRDQRFMDDWVIPAPSRHKLRAALTAMYAVLDDLKLEVHPDKRFIGRTTRGFDFLGYRFHSGRKLRPSQQGLDRLYECARRLHEQGADLDRLRQYVQRWFSWLHGGLRGRVSRHGRCQGIWIQVLRQLN